MSFRSARLFWICVGPLIAGAALLGAQNQSYAQASLELPIKAAFLYKFGDFVEWPEPREIFRICVIGPNPFGNLIDQVTAGERVGGKPIEILRMDAFRDGSLCSVAYLGGLDDGALPAALAALQGSAVLSVTDEAGHQEAGKQTGRGIIHFAVRQNRVRFFIDQRQAKRAGLTVRASLLALALPSQ